MGSKERKSGSYVVNPTAGNKILGQVLNSYLAIKLRKSWGQACINFSTIFSQDSTVQPAEPQQQSVSTAASQRNAAHSPTPATPLYWFCSAAAGSTRQQPASLEG